MPTEAPIDILDYHERTKHRFDRFAASPETIDWDAQPDPFRRFDGAPLLRLPLAADTLTLPYAALFQGDIPPAPLDRERLALLLELSLGLSAWKQYGDAKWSLRCNPSSGNLHPTEAYLISAGGAGLEDGVYHYRPDQHLLEQRCRFDDAAGEPALLIGLSSAHWREAWKYGERAYRYCQLDVGHAAAALSFAAASLGYRLRLLRMPGDAEIATLLGLDRRADFTGVEAEHPDLLLQLEHGTSSSARMETLLQRAREGHWQGRANRLDPIHFYDWPVVEAAAEGCRKPPTAEAPAVIEPTWPAPLPATAIENVSTLFRQRRSAQAFDSQTPMASADFFRLLDRLLPRPDIPPWDVMAAPPRLHLVLFVHRVEGIAPGLYALPRRPEVQPMLQAAMRDNFLWEPLAEAPDHLPLYRLINAKAQVTAAKLACQQRIAADSAFSLAMVAEFEPAVSAEPWRYRELHWEAGALGQVLYLEAEACGMRGTGIGCFFDDADHELLGLSGRELQVLYHFTVGAALNDPRIATLPPYHDRGAESQ